MSERPIGVAFLSILIMILGILGIIGGVLLAILSTVPRAGLVPWIYETSPIFLIAGIIVIVFALFYLIAGIGLWMLKHWGRILTLIIVILSLISSIFVLFAFPLGTILGILGILLDILIIVYLAGDVKDYFE